MAVRFETDNYVIRDVQFSDYEHFARWEVDPDMTKYFALDKDRTYEDVVTEGFAFKEDKSVIDLTITEKAPGIPWGESSFQELSPTTSPWISPRSISAGTGEVRASAERLLLA